MSGREVADRLRKRRLRAEVKTTEGALWVRGLSGRERDEYFSWIRGTRESGGSLFLSDHRIVALALCDEQGEPMFPSIDEGLEVVADWNSEDVTKIAKEILRLSGINSAAADDAEKKSPAMQS